MADPKDSKVTIDRTPGFAPRRVDNRSLLEMLHQEIGDSLGIGKEKQRRVGVDGKGLDDAVNEAITGATGKDSESF